MEKEENYSQPTYMIFINVNELLRFFDEKPESSRGHATAITQVCGEDLGANVFLHYLSSIGKHAEIISSKCTTGKKRGPRLDKWILVKEKEKTVLYQTEIKNWSSHAIGGRTLKIKAKSVEIGSHKIEEWQNQWDTKKKRFKLENHVGKVLIPMKPPIVSDEIRPLVIFWHPLHPTGESVPFFSVEVNDNKFNRAWIFSVSSYLRELHEKKICLKMPDTAKRLLWLDRLFSRK